MFAGTLLQPVKRWVNAGVGGGAEVPPEGTTEWCQQSCSVLADLSAMSLLSGWYGISGGAEEC